MKTYSNRFASMEQHSDGWIVFSEVSGLPVYVDLNADHPEVRRYPDYQSARAAMLELTEHYKAISRGPSYSR